jgi:ankyrin repeat protein
LAGETPLTLASSKGHKEIAKLLIEHGASINDKVIITNNMYE